MPNRIFAASDAHIGALNMHNWYARQAIAYGIRHCDEAVLAGDLFEAKSRALSERRRLGMCQEAITQWAKANPKATIHILLGNHENPIPSEIGSKDFAYCDDFMDKLKHYAKQYPNIHFHDRLHLQIGDSLFIHGHHEIEYPKSRFRDAVEGMASNAITGSSIAHWIMPKDRYTGNIMDYMQKEKLSGIGHIFFGHIHQDFLHHVPNGETFPKFHNLGTFHSINRQDANPVMITQDDSGCTTSIERFCKPISFRNNAANDGIAI